MNYNDIEKAADDVAQAIYQNYGPRELRDALIQFAGVIMKTMSVEPNVFYAGPALKDPGHIDARGVDEGYNGVGKISLPRYDRSTE